MGIVVIASAKNGGAIGWAAKRESNRIIIFENGTEIGKLILSHKDSKGVKIYATM